MEKPGHIFTDLRYQKMQYIPATRETNHRPLNQCTLLQTHRELLRNNVLKSGKWPVRKEELIMKHLK
jgi:hypothetical protein